MKTYVLYHGGCFDGFGAAFAAWLRFGEKATYIPVNYGQPFPAIDDGSTVFILDFSYPLPNGREALKELARRSEQLIILDHHATAQADLDGLGAEIGRPHIVLFNMNKSGAVLACEHFHGDAIKCEVGQLGEFFAYLQDRDLWKFELPMSREVSMALRSYPFDFVKWSNITGIVPMGQIYEMPGICIENLKREGVGCRRLTEQQVEIMAKNHRLGLFNTETKTIEFVEALDNRVTGAEVGRYIMPVANATVFFSEVGEKLLEMYPAMECAAYYMDRKDGNRQWGLRSRESFDSSVVARAFGGGGHKCASGFTQKLIQATSANPDPNNRLTEVRVVERWRMEDIEKLGEQERKKLEALS